MKVVDNSNGKFCALGRQAIGDRVYRADGRLPGKVAGDRSPSDVGMHVGG